MAKNIVDDTARVKNIIENIKNVTENEFKEDLPDLKEKLKAILNE